MLAMPVGPRPEVPESVAGQRLAGRLLRVRASLLRLEGAADLTRFGSRRQSARNLLHYLAFRRFDLRREQAKLSHWGLSSLGRSESHVLYNLDAVLRWLVPSAPTGAAGRGGTAGPDPEEGRRILTRNAKALFGPTRPRRRTRIMVTLPPEAATDYALVHGLLSGGMDVARINCAHDGPAAWSKMVSHVRRAERELERSCLIEMDLGGPKLRTGPIRPGPAVLKVRPERDRMGRVLSPAEFWLVPSGSAAKDAAGDSWLEMPPDWLRRRRAGEKLHLVDARGANRTLRVVERNGQCWRVESDRTTYFTDGTRLATSVEGTEDDASEVGRLPSREARLHLLTGDRIIVHAVADAGEDAVRDGRGRVLRPAHIACTLPEALAFVKPGESIWFDDGHIGGIVRSSSPKRLVVQITHTGPGGARLGGDKGINFPESELRLAPIPPSDLEDLRFITRHADLVGYSFVHTAADLVRLREELQRLGRLRMGIVVKIETGRAFEELPRILLAALRLPPVGIMIARGDLAVEVGYERLAEVQEEILWLCEAAHLPAIWATQVLEGLTKSGLPSRAEVTDAAMGERAECVMLNKGPHVVDAVRALDGILRRMQSHQAKKTAMLRHLQVVEPFFTGRSNPRSPALLRPSDPRAADVPKRGPRRRPGTPERRVPAGSVPRAGVGPSRRKRSADRLTSESSRRTTEARDRG
jgi:pyruvate kinase